MTTSIATCRENLVPGQELISGDTTPTHALLDHSRGGDVLIHEPISRETYRRVPPGAQEYRRHHHTSSIELAKIANDVKPGLL